MKKIYDIRNAKNLLRAIDLLKKQTEGEQKEIAELKRMEEEEEIKSFKCLVVEAEENLKTMMTILPPFKKAFLSLCKETFEHSYTGIPKHLWDEWSRQDSLLVYQCSSPYGLGIYKWWFSINSEGSLYIDVRYNDWKKQLSVFDFFIGVKNELKEGREEKMEKEGVVSIREILKNLLYPETTIRFLLGNNTKLPVTGTC